MLTRAEIKGFKCLRDVSVDLRPFNVLIGPNDSGKSSFLQALRESSHLAPTSWPAWTLAELASIHLWTRESDLRLSFDPDRSLRWAVAWKGQPIDPDDPHVARKLNEAARSFLRVCGPVVLDPQEISSLSPRGSGALDQLVASRGRGTAAHLARVALGDRVRYEAIQQGMRDVTQDHVREVLLEEDIGQGYPLSFRLHDGKVIPAADASQGLLLSLGLLALIHRHDDPALLLLEEPDKGLHPLRLSEVVRLLRTLPERGVQVLLTTHSPDLVDACAPEEILVFRRPEPGSGTEIHRLPADFKRRAMGASVGQVWASTGEEGLLANLPKIEGTQRVEAV